MAITYRFPVLVWKDHENYWTASLLEWDSPAGIGQTASSAIKQLQDFLQWQFQKTNWMDAPDFLEPKLMQFRVSVRPEYRQGERRYPCEETIPLRVHCAQGRQEHGLFICAIPLLDLRFYYYEERTLKTLVPHYVQQHLEGVTPLQLARYLPPAEVQLEDVVVTLRHRPTRNRRWEPDLDALNAVAEPIGAPQVRKQYGRPYERDQSVRNLVTRVHQEKANVLLVGESGSGKTTVLAEAVKLLERQSEEDQGYRQITQVKRRYWMTSASRLIAGMKYLGQWEERCEAIIQELASIDGYLCLENLLDMVREGGEGPRDSLASFFLPYLQRNELHVISEATPQELEACRRLLPGFADVFQIQKIEPFNREQAINVLGNVSSVLTQNLHLEMEPGVNELIYHLYRRFIPYQAFPARAVSFLRQLFERARREQRELKRQKSEQSADVSVNVERVIGEFTRQTGLPELFVRDEISLTRNEVRSEIEAQILGQNEACEKAIDLIMTFKAGMNDPTRPIGVLLFCGPTGVGKTALARTISKYFFEHGEETDRMIRLDMSEMVGPGAAERLVIQPDGQPSEMIRKVRQQPFVVLLLDEIEKADPIVFDVLLNVFDEGRLTDRFGRLTTFRSAIIIMTSNLGAGKQTSFGFGDQPQVEYESEALDFFRPEFFNRMDTVVTFRPLTRETILDITRKELSEISQREGFQRWGLRLEWSDALVEHLAEKGFDAQYGARPLQRTIESMVVTPLARYLLDQTELRNATLKLDLGSETNLEISLCD